MYSAHAIPHSLLTSMSGLCTLWALQTYFAETLRKLHGGGIWAYVRRPSDPTFLALQRNRWPCSSNDIMEVIPKP